MIIIIVVVVVVVVASTRLVARHNNFRIIPITVVVDVDGDIGGRDEETRMTPCGSGNCCNYRFRFTRPNSDVLLLGIVVVFIVMAVIVSCFYKVR